MDDSLLFAVSWLPLAAAVLAAAIVQAAAGALRLDPELPNPRQHLASLAS